MEQSLFIQWIKKYFPAITVSIVEKLNDRSNTTELPYLHRTMLRPAYSVTGKWEALTILNSLVAADVVSMDSSLPLKKRPTVRRASGDIPKMGMQLKLNETQLTELNTLISQAGAGNSQIINNQIITRIFEDVPRVIRGIYERNEFMFLQGLSTGVTSVIDSENVGTEVRLDFGYLNENKFGVAALWDNPDTATPLDDIQAVLEKATNDGVTVVRVLIDRVTKNKLLKTRQVRELYAFGLNFVGANIPTPSLAQLNPTIQSHYGFVFEEVNRSVRVEKNGVQTSIKPWQEGMLIFLTTNDYVGSLAWATLAEQAFPAQGVEYQTVDDYILVSMYRKPDPIGEFTSSQSRCVPVISGVENIYSLNSKEVTA